MSNEKKSWKSAVTPCFSFLELVLEGQLQPYSSHLCMHALHTRVIFIMKQVNTKYFCLEPPLYWKTSSAWARFCYRPKQSLPTVKTQRWEKQVSALPTWEGVSKQLAAILHCRHPCSWECFQVSGTRADPRAGLLWWQWHYDEDSWTGWVSLMCGDTSSCVWAL